MIWTSWSVDLYLFSDFQTSALCEVSSRIGIQHLQLRAFEPTWSDLTGFVEAASSSLALTSHKPFPLLLHQLLLLLPLLLNFSLSSLLSLTRRSQRELVAAHKKQPHQSLREKKLHLNDERFSGCYKNSGVSQECASARVSLSGSTSRRQLKSESWSAIECGAAFDATTKAPRTPTATAESSWKRKWHKQRGHQNTYKCEFSTIKSTKQTFMRSNLCKCFCWHVF